MRSLSRVVAPPIVICVPVSENASAGQESSIAGASERTPLPPLWSLARPEPIVPVSPTAAMSNEPPIGGDVFEIEIDVILFELALMMSSTELKPSVPTQTCVEPVWFGFPFQTSTLNDCALPVAERAVR